MIMSNFISTMSNAYYSVSKVNEVVQFNFLLWPSFVFIEVIIFL